MSGVEGKLAEAVLASMARLSKFWSGTWYLDIHQMRKLWEVPVCVYIA